MLELYIFNKESPAKNGLTYWDCEQGEGETNTLSFNLDRFKFKENQHIFTELAQEMNYLYKESEKLKSFFEKLSGESISVELRDDYHHLLCYDSEREVLILDSKIQNKMIPLYIFASYYALCRKSHSEDEIYRKMFDFFLAFDWRALESIVNQLERDSAGPKNYDTGGYLCDYVKKLLRVKKNPEIYNLDSLTEKLNEKVAGITKDDSYTFTQLLRNRTLAGKMPFNLKHFEELEEKYKDDAFAGEALQEYFESFSESFDKEFAKVYYKHLCDSLRYLGYAVVAQRGSRVAHEQGPILINSGTIKADEEFVLAVRKQRSSVIDSISKIEEFVQKNQIQDEQLKQLILNLNLDLDNLLYLCDLGDAAKSRFDRALIDIEGHSQELINKLSTKIKNLPKQDKFWTAYDQIKSHEKVFTNAWYELKELVDSAPSKKKVAVIYVQRPSSRSGHFIPRILLAQNLYIETDAESHEQRLKAIPFNFVSPDFDLIAAGIDSFFENASISIVTDRKTGEPDIKWENAEDLAISLAPGMYAAIKSAAENGRRFHYQLETTLFGPLIELFLAILEQEMSNIASMDRHETLTAMPDALNLTKPNSVLTKTLEEYNQEVEAAADLVFKYYLLEDQLQEHMLIEGLNKQEAIFDMALTLRDVQQDIAKYCLLKRQDQAKFNEFKDFADALIKQAGTDMSYKSVAESISSKLSEHISSSEAKNFVKKYIRYPESTARKEFLEANPKISKITVCSNKNIQDIDYYYDFTVAPSRIDFGKHVVASVTTLMGRMLGADDEEALLRGKEYIDLVSKTQNSFFETAAEAGSVKVIENTCRAIQYSKAISFQGVFQAFNIDGALARMTINSRNTKAAGLHVMEYGTMASTGYCITKEPLFIILGLAIDSEMLFDKLGVNQPSVRAELKDLFKDLVANRKNFKSNLDWQLYCYEELMNSASVQKYLSDPQYRWLPNLESMATLFKYVSDSGDPDSIMARTYSRLASQLIEFARVINETGIIQRTQLMNSAIRRAQIALNTKKDYSDLIIALNASYKGNVSDERENANQYLIALLLHQKQYLKNVSNPDIEKLVDHQINNYALPKEIRVFDPLVDPDIFMGGELKAKTEATVQKLMSLEFKTPLSPEVIEACAVTYGSNFEDWRVVSKRLKELEAVKAELVKEKLAELQPELKYLELYYKGFYKDPLLGFQSVDAIQLNSDHDDLIAFLENLVQLKNIMKINNPDSLLVLVDNPQQGKRPFFDYDKALEWLALGGTLSSHIISEESYESWRAQIDKQSEWAKLFMQKLIMAESLEAEQLGANADYQKLCQELTDHFDDLKNFADLKRDLLLQKFNDAQEMGVSYKSLMRYQEWINCLGRIANYQSADDIDFVDWLILGGRWILNGHKQKDIDYVVNLFEKSSTLKNLGKRGHELMHLFVLADEPPEIEQKVRIIENAGSTKEADLLVSSAGDSLEFRSMMNQQNHAVLLRMQEFNAYEERVGAAASGLDALSKLWDSFMQEYLQGLSSGQDLSEQNKLFAKMLKVLEKYAGHFYEYDPNLKDITNTFVKMKEADQWSLIEVFGDHRKHGGSFQVLAEAAENDDELEKLSKLGEIFINAYLIFLTIGVEDENEVVNNLAIFFDQYLNVHEEDYAPYMFHSLCAGASYGFTQTYYLDPNLRTKMFKLACKTGITSYKLLHFLIANKSVLKHSSQEYKDSLIGDYENGIIPIGYQHEGICIEERLWDCMRALRNFIRNYHDRHPLPVIIKGKDASVDKLFRYRLDDDVKLSWVAGVSNPGKHSWDMNCVFRSPLLRDTPCIEEKTGTKYINVSVFAPYLTKHGEIKQVYTSFRQEVLEEGKVEYLAPFSADFEHELYASEQVKGHKGSYIPNNEGFVHALVMLEPDLPKPDITMAAHTHSQYINNFLRDQGVPEVWSMLSMQQMYAKTEVPKILKEIDMDALAQIDFLQKDINDKDDLKYALEKRLTANGYDHIDYWILKGSRDSGGRGISGRLSISNDLNEIVDFIFQKTRTDDLVMQEFVPNNARSFISPEFAAKVEDAFVEEGLSIEQTTPFEKIFFAMRSFQSVGGIKGYLFSANLGAVTVNAGQGAKMFYGEPILIMPLYIATKIQKLLDEQGELILKEAIPKHAEKFARVNDISVRNNSIGSNNTYMLNGLFDYIPYIYAERNDKNAKPKRFKVLCEDNVDGGLDYFYSYYGERIDLASGSDHKQSLDAIEQVLKDSANEEWQGPEALIDIDLAKIEFNSGLGQANLLQRAIEEMAPNNRDLFLEWTEDLGAIGIASQLARASKS